jgi:hypothetical protein
MILRYIRTESHLNSNGDWICLQHHHTHLTVCIRHDESGHSNSVQFASRPLFMNSMWVQPGRNAGKILRIVRTKSTNVLFDNRRPRIALDHQ